MRRDKFWDEEGISSVMQWNKSRDEEGQVQRYSGTYWQLTCKTETDNVRQTCSFSKEHAWSWYLVLLRLQYMIWELRGQPMWISLARVPQHRRLNWDRDSPVWCSLCTCWESPVVLQGHQDNRTSWPESPTSLVSGPCPAWSIGPPHASGHTAILTILTPYNHNY